MPKGSTSKKTSSSTVDKSTKKSKRTRSPSPSGTAGRVQNVKRVKNASKSTVGGHYEENTGTKVASTRIPSPNFSGNFDLYSMELDFLSKVYVNKAGPPKFEELYKKILTYQAKNDRTAQIYLASPDHSTNSSQFKCIPMADPMDDSTYDIKVDTIRHHEKLAMPTLKFPSGVAANTCGITALLSLKEEGCGFVGSKGTFHLRRIWTKLSDNADIIELFEGYVYFETTFSGLYRRKGHGPGQKYPFSLWAVRARVDEKGNEVGLEKDIVKVLVALGSGEPAKHPRASGDVIPPQAAENVEQDSDDDSDDGDEWPSMYSQHGGGYDDDYFDYDSDENSGGSSWTLYVV